MKFGSKIIAAFLIFLSGSVFADVNLKISSDISLLAINGKEVESSSFFSTDKQFELENGINQILIQLNAEFKRSGDSEFHSSDTHVLLFNAEDIAVMLQHP